MNSISGGGSNTDTQAPPPAAPLPPAKIVPWSQECGDVTGVAGASYCTYSNSPTPRSTIWFFHGLADSPQVFQEALDNSSWIVNRDSYLQLLQGLPATRIVSITFGLSWLLNVNPVRSDDLKAATVDVFKNQIMPFLEKKYSTVKPYSVVGHSMGGYNASTLCTVMPDTWSKCALLNAMIPKPDCDVYESSFCDAGPGLVIRANLSADDWKNYSPLSLVSKAPRLPKAFVTACADDGFGLYPGPQAWAQKAASRGFDVVWEPVASNCDHVHWPANDLIKFLYQN